MSAPFGNVELDFPQRLVGICRVHLVGSLVGGAEILSRPDRVAERPVESGCVLGRIGEEVHVLQAFGVECLSDRADTAVHHVAWCDDVAARLGLYEGLLAEHLHRLVVEDHAVANDAILAVRRVRVEGYVANDADVVVPLLDRAHRAADEVVRIVSLPCRRDS